MKRKGFVLLLTIFVAFFMSLAVAHGQQETLTEGIKIKCLTIEGKTTEQDAAKVESDITSWLEKKNIKVIDMEMSIVQILPGKDKHTFKFIIHYLKLD